MQAGVEFVVEDNLSVFEHVQPCSGGLDKNLRAFRLLAKVHRNRRVSIARLVKGRNTYERRGSARGDLGRGDQ